MINLESLFVNWFEGREITNTRLTIFARQHLLGVQAENGAGAYNDIIAATEPLLTTCENGLTDRNTKEGIEKGRVQSKELFRSQLSEKIRKLFSAVVVAYGDPSPDLTICFPSGRKVFAINGCKDEDLNNHLEQLKAALNERSATVGATHVTTITSLCTQWSALYVQRWLAGAATEQSVAAQETAFAALRTQLCKNVHTVAMHNIGNLEACRRLLPQSVLFPSQAQLPGACTITVETGIGQFSGSAQASGATIIHWFTRAAGTEGEWAEIGTSEPGAGAAFSGMSPGSYEVKAVGENEKGTGPESEVAIVEVT